VVGVRALFVAFALLTTIVLAACGDPGGSGSVATSGDVPTTTAPTGATASAAGPGADTALIVDARLLGILPASVAGIAMAPAPDAAAGMIGDAGLAQAASGVAVGMVVAPGGSRGDDLAVSTVIQLRPGIFSDAFYRDWRESYDTAACAPAGGVASHVQQLIGPHTVDVTVCSQGARTYHTHLPGDRLVSVTAVGDRTFGDLVMAGLRQ